MEKNNISALEEQFIQECKLINLNYEYPGYTGEEKPFRLLEHFRFKILPDNWGHFGISGDISFCHFS